MPRLARPSRTRCPTAAAKASAPATTRVSGSALLRAFGFALPGTGCSDRMNYTTCNIVHADRAVNSAETGRRPSSAPGLHPAFLVDLGGFRPDQFTDHPL